MSKKRYMEGRNQALEQIIQDQQNQLETKDFIIDQQGKESDQYLMTAKYLTHIFLLMDSLDKILENNCTMGVVVKEAMLAFKKKLSKGMLLFNYDGDNVIYDPNNETVGGVYDEEEE